MKKSQGKIPAQVQDFAPAHPRPKVISRQSRLISTEVGHAES